MKTYEVSVVVEAENATEVVDLAYIALDEDGGEIRVRELDEEG